MPRLSVVVPVYRGSSFLEPLHRRLHAALSGLTRDYEIVLVEDGGGDDSWRIIESLCRRDKRVRGIKLSRNFGQHQAIAAGLDHSKGDWTVIMDGDLQDLPEEIPRLYAAARRGFDIVLARRAERSHSFLRRSASRLFYALLAYLTDTEQDPCVANFGIYSRKAMDAVRSMRESFRYFPAMIRWVGFPVFKLDVKHEKRARGASTYTWRKLLRLALDVMISFSEKPLRLAVKLGLALSLLSFLGAVLLLVRAVVVRQMVPGWSSLMVSVWFLSGLIIFVLGMVGIYIGKIFHQVKNRPLYIIERARNLKRS